jgi:acetyl-CoA carboxylase biotin carboxyl carrier protein
VGRFVDALDEGARLGAGGRLGALEVLGRRRDLVLPAVPIGMVGPNGRVAAPLAPGSAVAFGDTLAWLETGGEPAPAVTGEAAGPLAALQDGGAAVRSPSSGRYYQRPAPGKPPFLEIGDVVESGQTVGLLEVMKTFTRIHYGGPGLPDPAVVIELVAADGEEVEEGAVLVLVEPVTHDSG